MYFKFKAHLNLDKSHSSNQKLQVDSTVFKQGLVKWQEAKSLNALSAKLRSFNFILKAVRIEWRKNAVMESGLCLRHILLTVKGMLD